MHKRNAGVIRRQRRGARRAQSSRCAAGPANGRWAEPLAFCTRAETGQQWVNRYIIEVKLDLVKGPLRRGAPRVRHGPTSI